MFINSKSSAVQQLLCTKLKDQMPLKDPKELS